MVLLVLITFVSDLRYDLCATRHRVETRHICWDVVLVEVQQPIQELRITPKLLAYSCGMALRRKSSAFLEGSQ